MTPAVLLAGRTTTPAAPMAALRPLRSFGRAAPFPESGRQERPPRVVNPGAAINMPPVAIWTDGDCVLCRFRASLKKRRRVMDLQERFPSARTNAPKLLQTSHFPFAAIKTHAASASYPTLLFKVLR